MGHGSADAACDPGALRGTIKEELGAEAHIQANPSRAIKPPPLDRDLSAERHEGEDFFQQINRFRRTALRREKTVPSLMGFVCLVSALDRPG